MTLQNMAYWVVKGRLLQCKRWSFAAQYAMFYIIACDKTFHKACQPFVCQDIMQRKTISKSFILP